MRKLQMDFCYEQIDSEYRDVWDTFDCHDQQQFIDYLDNKYEEKVHKEKRQDGPKVKTSFEDLDRITRNPVISKLLGQLDLELIDDQS